VWNFGRTLAVLLSLLVGLLLALVERLILNGPRRAIPLLVAAALMLMPFGKSVMGVSLGQATSATGQALVLIAPLLLLWGRQSRNRDRPGAHRA
jgi:hypothetical protein